MKKLVIMRGLPGSGKSTKAKELDTEHYNSTGKHAIVCSADSYFIGKDGIYNFNAKLLGHAHQTCIHNAALAMENENELVIVDNTNTTKWEFARYLEMAKFYHYEIEIVSVGERTPEAIQTYFNRNIHCVPLEAIQRMANRWED